MALDKKGQASVELIFITFIVLVVMAGMLSFVSNEMNQVQTADIGKARTVGEKFAGAINAVYVAGSGYSANFTIPGGLTVPPSTFTVNDATDSVVVSYNGNTMSIKLVATNLTTFSTSSTANDKTITIKNQKGKLNFTVI